MRGRDSGSRVVVVERGGGFSWLLAGAALGAGLALLFAPAPGKETRRRLKEQLGKLRETVGEAAEELREAIDPDRPAAAGERERAEAERPSRNISSARAELERRLSAARARHQRTQAEDDEEPVA